MTTVVQQARSMSLGGIKTVKLVVVGDGAVGKVRRPLQFCLCDKLI